MSTMEKGKEVAIRQQFAVELQKELTTKRVVVGAATGVGLVLAIPAAMAAATVIPALAVAGALGAGALVAWKSLPHFVLRIENAVIEANQREMNRHLASLKTEAKKNPIEQAENEYLRRSGQYDQFKTAMEQIGGKVLAFGSKLERIRREKPGYDLSQEMRAHDRMKEFYEKRMLKLQQAKRALDLFREKIDEARVKWEFQLDANDAIRAMNATDQNSKINEILTEVAFDSVQQEFDAVFAKLDVDAAELNASSSLDFGKGSVEGAVIDVSTITIPEVQHAA